MGCPESIGTERWDWEKSEDLFRTNSIKILRNYNTFTISTPFSGQFRRQCMHFGNSADNFGGSAVRQPVGHDSAAAMSKLVALLPNYMQIVQNWSEKGVYTHGFKTHQVEKLH